MAEVGWQVITEINLPAVGVGVREACFMTPTARHSNKVAPTFSSFNPCPSLPFIAIDDRKQFQIHAMLKYLNNKTRPLFWNSKTF